MATQSEQAGASGHAPVGDHRRLHDLLCELRHRAGDPSLRKIHGVSGVSIGYLSQIFTGKTAPGPDVAVKVARALKATDREQARIRFYADGSGADRAARTAPAGRDRRTGWEGCPYLGLRPFEEEHAAVFYGRRTLTGRLLDRLREHPPDAGVLLVLGPSGAGKSSLLRAGLMGSLADDALAPGSQFWPRRVILPAGDPVRQLAVHLAELAATDAISVQEALTAHPGRAHLLAGQALAAAGGSRRLVLGGGPTGGAVHAHHRRGTHPDRAHRPGVRPGRHAPSPGTPTRCTRRRTARTGGTWPAATATGSCGSGPTPG
ncbi:XRE family transcriptional regulator [Actinoplanes sp. G11-F43]|uniref:XRE family transcriptional regulator n=1 Tax=Actinoplanes sp. G11-F43 TaxID=3424130 RepID=UPI003D34D014